MFKVALFAFITIWVSATLGIFIDRHLKLGQHSFKTPFGFAGLLCLLQILYYPAQLFNFPSLYIHGISVLVYLVLGIYSLFILKELKQEFLCKKSLLVGGVFLFFLFTFYHLSISLDFADTQMYLNYVSQNIQADKLNMFNIWTGLAGQEWDSIYLFQGYYHFMSFACYFVNGAYYLFGAGGFVENIVTSTWGMGMIYSIVSTMMFINFVDYFDWKKKWVKVVVMAFTLLFSNFYYWRVAFSFYGNTFRSLFISMLLFVLFRYFKEEKPHYKYLCMMLMTAGIACSSSYLFVSFSIMYGLMVYLFKTGKKNAISEMADFVFPLLVYAIAKFSKDNVVVALVLLILASLYYALRKTTWMQSLVDKIESFLHQHAIVLFFILFPILTVVYSIWLYFIGDPTFDYNFFHYFNDHQGYDMVKDYYFVYSSWRDNLLNVIRWGAVAILLFQKPKNKGMDYVRSLFILMFVFFLNPLNISFISKNIASNVYYRSFEVVFNPFTETLLFFALLKYFDGKKVIKGLVCGSLVVSIFVLHIGSYLAWSGGDYHFYVEEGELVNSIFKLYPEDYEVLTQFRSMVQDNPVDYQLTVISHAEGMRTFLPQTYQLFTARQYWYAWDRVDENFYQMARRHYSWQDNSGIDYKKACQYVQQFDVDYALIKYWENWEFDNATNECMDVIWQSDYYKIKRSR